MTNETLTLEVPIELKGKRLDQVLAKLCPEHSRSRLQSWIQSGHVLVNGESLRQKDTVQGGENITISPTFQATDDRWNKENLPLNIIHSDDMLIIINKPIGLVVHPGAGNPEHTLLNGLLYHFPELEKVPRAGIVQRLDKDTSGLMVIARTPSAHTYLVEKLQSRQVTREYQAIVTGLFTAGGTVDAPIGRHPVHRKRMAIVTSGKTATTHYRIIKRFAAHTHIRCLLESGRTHQIRVHMAHIRHPIVGDSVYGGRPVFPKQASETLLSLLQNFPRQALHASKLELVHPKTQAITSWESTLPDDITQLLTELTNNANPK